MFRTRRMALGLAVLLQACAGNPPMGIGKGGTAAKDGPVAAGGWSVWTEARVIPDADRRGILIGPLVPNAGADLSRVILRLDLRHPATEDLAIRLACDADGDQRPEISIPIEFYQSHSGPSDRELHACPQAVNRTYFFRDRPDEAEQVFAAFRSLPPGRAFYLLVADTLAGNLGVVLSWAIHTEPPGAEAAR